VYIYYYLYGTVLLLFRPFIHTQIRSTIQLALSDYSVPLLVSSYWSAAYIYVYIYMRMRVCVCVMVVVVDCHALFIVLQD